ncbi:MAG: hypothetical protein QNJ47_01270 [Nostocaceae cyanobacterium]|nr:hypothetical protein [Nostocaceae cyanobacterium]
MGETPKTALFAVPRSLFPIPYSLFPIPYFQARKEQKDASKQQWRSPR